MAVGVGERLLRAMIAGQPVGKAVGIRGFDLGQLAGVAPLIWLGWRYVTTATPAKVTPAAATELALQTRGGAVRQR
jgi:hypothetical protein